MKRVVLLIFVISGGLLGAVVLGLYWISELTQQGLDERRLRHDTQEVLIAHAAFAGAVAPSDMCRTLVPDAAIDWANICTTSVTMRLPYHELHGHDGSIVRTVHDCGVEVMIEDAPSRHSRDIQMLVLYEYDDFADLAARGWTHMMANLPEQLADYEAAWGDRPFTERPFHPIHPHTLETFLGRFNDASADFHSCETANFIHLQGTYMSGRDWADRR